MDGIGLFLVLSIKESISFSIIWLKEFEAPTIQYPPKASKKRVYVSDESTANKYPTTDEKTTLIASLALVNSKKDFEKNKRELLELTELLLI